MERETSQRAWYSQYYHRSGPARNDLRRNPEVLFQALASEASVVNALRVVQHEPSVAKVLDVGCGSGGDVYQLVRLGYDPAKITGIEIQQERIAVARSLYPQMEFIHADATKMQFEDDTFDLVFESTMFATLPDDHDRAAIASEMVRVCKPEGFLVLIDWRTPKPGDRSYKALSRRELQKIFAIGSRTKLIAVQRGALLPPIGRFLSKRAPGLYFICWSLFPFLVGQVVYVLTRKGQIGEAGVPDEANF